MFFSAKCGHCGGTRTKLGNIEPEGAQFKQSAIVCSSCSAILGVSDYYDVGHLIKEQEKEIEKLNRKVDQMSHVLNQIADFLNRSAR